MNVYVVLMRRWGDPDLHSYVIGAYSTKELADRAGEAEHHYRGTKYDPTVIELEVDFLSPHLELKDAE